MKRTIATFFAAALAITACESPTPPATSEGAGEAADHAPRGVEPGSHEDWCGEHQVPESMCTRCNKSLVAGFKATGDWCEDHQMPKSQCLACDPNLKIERPPKKETP